MLIFLQAARGRSSHFNAATLFDGAVYQAMGTAIAVFWVCQIVAAVLLLRQRFTDPALAASLRLGLILSVLGAGVGWVMAAHSGHTVGGPDGGPGLPLTNWSVQHGDLRSAHFFGLHALQALPLVAWLARRSPARQRERLVVAAGVSYGALFFLLLAQALRGLPLTALDTPALLALGAWAAVTLALVGRALIAPSAAALEAA